MPFILTGLRLAVGRAFVGVLVGELYAATAGVGFMITVAGATFQTDKVFVGVLIFSLSGMVLTESLNALESRFDKSGGQKSARSHRRDRAGVARPRAKAAIAYKLCGSLPGARTRPGYTHTRSISKRDGALCLGGGHNYFRARPLGERYEPPP